MKKILITLLTAAAMAGQTLTPAQKEFDFRAMANVFATHYAPLDWKKDLLNVDIRQLKPWLDRAALTKTDIEFYEVCLDYTNSLQDTHVSFSLPSDFFAQLGVGVDVYEGAFLIDFINRTLLPVAAYPFTFGDELLSIDGVDANVLAERLNRYVAQGNPRAQLRRSAQFLTSRGQSRFPDAPSLPESATLVIRRQSGAAETYTMKWVKTGTPLAVGPVPGPRILPSAKTSAKPSAEDDYMKPLRELQHSGILDRDLQGVNGVGNRNPIFLGALTGNFTRRLGGAGADAFYSGTFRRGDLTIGFIRIPSFSPASTPVALDQLETEIRFLCASSIRREPWAGPSGDVLAYEKPIMVLIDEFSTSSADSFASMMQDSGRAILFGYRTNGAGGNNFGFRAGPYSEGFVGVTIALQTRAMRANPGYPASIYTENIGVHPEVVDDYMTKDNLLRNGAPFVADFLEAMDAYIRQRK